MSDTEQDAPAKRRQPIHTVMYYLGVAILVLGLACAAIIFVFAEDNGDVDAADEVANARMYQHNIELMGGKLAVYTDSFNRWFANLWHGKTLAYTIGVLAVVMALACFALGRILSVPLPPEPDDGGNG